MAADPLRYHRRFALVGALLTLVEVTVVGGPLWVFFKLTERQKGLLQTVGPVAIGCGWLIWWIAMRVWRAPIDRAVARRLRGELLTQPEAQATYLAILDLPRRAGWLRAALAGALGALLGGLLAQRAGLHPEAVLAVTVIAFLHTLLMQVFRVVVWARLLASVRDALIADIEPLRLFHDAYFPRLMREALATGVVGVVAIAAFTYFFLPISLEQYLRIETWFPFTTFVLTGAWLAVSRRLTAPIERYLDAATAPGAAGPPSGKDERALVAYGAAQSLPYKLALATIAFWVLGEVLLVIEGTLLFGVDLENAGLMFGAALVVTVGIALYEGLWHRATMRPLLVHLATRHRLHLELARTPLSLRSKMLLSFAGLTFFACGLSLFWSFVQYKNLATAFIQRATELRLGGVLAELQALSARAGRPPGAADIARTLAEAARDEAVIYYVPPEAGARSRAFGGGKVGPPELPWSGEAVMRRLERGQIELSGLHLSGAYARLYDEAHRDLGSIAVLYPGYRGRGPSIDRQIKELLVFFVILAAVSLGIVVLVVADLTGPIRVLEKRAGAMAQGDLSRPVIHVAGEADEVGRLTFAIDEMRRALNEKLRSSTEINLSLEQEVQRRTAELERRNQELNGALDALQRTQDELVRSEKMASMGRLVAGIAHEINNPVNAVVNTAAPLEATLEDLLGRSGSITPAEAAEAAEEVRGMIRVIQRGARRTKEIVQALHNYSRGDDDRLVDVDLHRGIDESLDLLRHHIKHGISVERDYGDVGRVRGYAGQLHQVFMNLLTNAAQALVEELDAGRKREGVIHIATAREGGKAVITVSDNGPGIPADLLPRIFDPFFTTKEVGKGSGLGLSIVHGIVERHGGTISVQSEVGRGTTFTVILPVDQERRSS